jgi:hypothetical protein
LAAEIAQIHDFGKTGHPGDEQIQSVAIVKNTLFKHHRAGKRESAQMDTPDAR